MLKCLLPFSAPAAYSTIFSCTLEVFSSQGMEKTRSGQLKIHSPQPVHFDLSSVIFFPLTLRALGEHHLTQAAQPVQSDSFTDGFKVSCMEYLPALVPQPMPMFLRAPPKPEISWPLKWLIKTRESEKFTAFAILTFLKCFRFTSTSAPEFPLRPSAIITGQPQFFVVKP